MTTRQSMWEALGQTPLDLLVVGGGITGVAVARDAALRGMRVALVEMRDFAYGTSSRSTKLVHGGLRYLEQGDVGLVFESVTERGVLTRMAPHVVRPLGFVLPVFENAPRKLAIVDAGLWVYDALSLFRSPKVHRRIPKAELSREEPTLDTRGLEGAALYFDCATDDARLTIEVALDAAARGAVLSTWTRVVGFLRDEGGAVVGARVRDELTGAEKDVRAAAVVNATGPWSDHLLRLAGDARSRILRPTKGVHLVVEHAKLPLTHAVLLQHPKDARVMFAIPWGDRTYVGTTDTDADADPSEVRATADDVAYILDAASAYFPRHPLTRDDVIATWAGLRPLLAPPETGDHLSESQVSREHHLFVDRDGLVTIAGGKLTTFRIMAKQTVDEVVRRIHFRRTSPTHDLRTRAPLPGALDLADPAARRDAVERVLRVAQGSLPADVAANLVDTYGARAVQVAGYVLRDASLGRRLASDRPEIFAQVAYGLDEELASTVEDILVRRTQVFFRARDQGTACAPEVARFLAARRGLDAAAAAAMTETYLAEVRRSRAYRDEPVRAAT